MRNRGFSWGAIYGVKQESFSLSHSSGITARSILAVAASMSRSVSVVAAAKTDPSAYRFPRRPFGSSECGIEFAGQRNVGKAIPSLETKIPSPIRIERHWRGQYRPAWKLQQPLMVEGRMTLHHHDIWILRVPSFNLSHTPRRKRKHVWDD
jgi:hypothetical protein